MKQAKYKRTGHFIETIENDEVIHVDHYKSINEAKRASTKLQIQTDGALGRGSLVVEKE